MPKTGLLLPTQALSSKSRADPFIEYQTEMIKPQASIPDTGHSRPTSSMQTSAAQQVHRPRFGASPRAPKCAQPGEAGRSMVVLSAFETPAHSHARESVNRQSAKTYRTRLRKSRLIAAGTSRCPSQQTLRLRASAGCIPSWRQLRAPSPCRPATATLGCLITLYH